MTKHDVIRNAQRVADQLTKQDTEILNESLVIPKKDLDFIEWAHQISSTVSYQKESLKNVWCDEESLKRGYKIENLSWSEISEELINEFSDFFLETFRNPPYSQFAFHIDNPTTPLSPQQMGMPMKKHYSIEETESFKLPKWYLLWSSRKKTFEITKTRLRQWAYISRMVDFENQKTVGLVYWRRATLRNVFETEEMKNPLLFSEFQDPKLYANEQQFFEKMKYHCWLKSDTQIFYISCMAINRNFQWLKTLHRLMKTFFSSIDKSDLDLFSFSELESQWSAHDIDIALSWWVEIFWILENWHPITAWPLRPFAQNYYLPFKDLFGIIKKYKIEQKTYKPHEQDNINAILKDTENMWKGVFANKEIKKWELIANFIWNKYLSSEAIKLPSVMINHAIQIWNNEYVYAQNRLAEKINHSCEPNCWINNLTKVVAMRDIDEWEEITWDYWMSEDSNWKCECKCWTLSCTWTIKSFKDIPSITKNKYLKEWFISQWIIDNYNKN